MPVLLRELPRANDMGTLHTHAMTPIDESNLYRKWCVPAALINALASVTLMSDDDVDELAQYDPPTSVFTHWPMVLFPAYLVPFSIILHITMIRALLANRRRARDEHTSVAASAMTASG